MNIIETKNKCSLLYKQKIDTKKWNNNKRQLI